MSRVVVVSSVDPAPLFLTTIPFIQHLLSSRAEFEVVLTTPSYPLWDWEGWRDLDLARSELIFIGDVLTPRSFYRYDALISITSSTLVVTGSHCARLLRRARGFRGLVVQDYRGFAVVRGIPQPPPELAEAVSRDSWRALALTRYIFAEVLDSPLATSWAREAAEAVSAEGAGYLEGLARAYLGGAINTIMDMVDSGSLARRGWGVELRPPLAGVRRHALLLPIAARAARRASAPVLAGAVDEASGWASMAFYDPKSRGSVSGLARILEWSAAEAGGYPTCGRYSVELTVRSSLYDRVLDIFTSRAAGLESGALD